MCWWTGEVGGCEVWGGGDERRDQVQWDVWCDVTVKAKRKSRVGGQKGCDDVVVHLSSPLSLAPSLSTRRRVLNIRIQMTLSDATHVVLHKQYNWPAGGRHRVCVCATTSLPACRGMHGGCQE